MTIVVEKLERIVAHAGRMRLVETELPRHYSLMRAGTIESFLGQISEQEMRDMFDLFGDVITYLDTEQPPLEHGTVEGFNASCRCSLCLTVRSTVDA